MLDNERIQELKQNAELIIELIEKIEYLMESSDRSEGILEKEKKYYEDEYKKVSDAFRDFRRSREKQRENGCTVIQCGDKCCLHNSNGICQSGEIELNADSYCLLAERNPMCDCK